MQILVVVGITKRKHFGELRDLSEFRLKLFGPKWIRVLWEQQLTKGQSVLRGQQKGCEKMEDK